ncbi:sulfotransferase 1C2-like [Littorina saxatilis]|uniref:Sulfotransferase domain-containing protein n=1 Tax=Littorina saxatilis TaxID=31220 RepID=A0AAN9AJN0_9CAEN
MRTLQFSDGRGATLELEELDGVLYPRYHDHLEQQLQQIRKLHVRDSDVILCTYPKAGTHWLWEVITMLVNHISKFSNDLKQSAMLENTDLDLVNSQPSPRVLNTHLLPDALPDMTWLSQCRLVVCHRNPKDTVVSLYNMARQVSYKQIRSAFEGTFEGYASLFLDGKMPHGSWFDYVRAWEQVRRRPPADRIYVGSYESMSRDTVGEVRHLADFLGTGTSESLCEDIARACSFQNMKQATKHQKGAANPEIWKPDATGIFRKGKVGDWKDWMTMELSEAFDRATLARLSDLDLEFTYEL